MKVELQGGSEDGVDPNKCGDGVGRREGKEKKKENVQ